MSITLRAQVIRLRKNPWWNRPVDQRWAVRRIEFNSSRSPVAFASPTRYARSWPEAMQLAYKMLADRDAELMTEVHASRSSRRSIPSPVAACGDDPYDDFCPTCDAPVPSHTETCAVVFPVPRAEPEPIPATAHVSLVTTTEATA